MPIKYDNRELEELKGAIDDAMRDYEERESDVDQDTTLNVVGFYRNSFNYWLYTNDGDCEMLSNMTECNEVDGYGLVEPGLSAEKILDNFYENKKEERGDDDEATQTALDVELCRASDKVFDRYYGKTDPYLMRENVPLRRAYETLLNIFHKAVHVVPEFSSLDLMRNTPREKKFIREMLTEMNS